MPVAGAAGAVGAVGAAGAGTMLLLLIGMQQLCTDTHTHRSR